MYTKIFKIGQEVCCSLYGGRYGYITKIEGQQSPETCRTLLGGTGSSGGNAQLEIAFLDHFTNIPESIVRTSVQWRVTDNVLTEVELQEVVAETEVRLQAKQAAKAEEERKKSEERTRQLTAHDYAHLTPVKDAYADKKIVTKNIRMHLKHAFPGVKFSVTRPRFNHVDVNWTGGPTTKEVDAALDNFQSIYGYDVDDSAICKNHKWIFGTVKFLFTERNH